MGNLNEKTKKNWERGLLTLMTGTALTIGCHRADTSSMSGSSLPEATARYNAGDGLTY